MCHTRPPPQSQQQHRSSHQPRRCNHSRARRGSRRDRDTSVNVVASDLNDVESSDCFIGDDDAERSWSETVLINGSCVHCKLDSGAEGNVMSLGTFNKLKKSSELRSTKVRLFDFPNRIIDAFGVATLSVRHKDREHQLDFIIVARSGPTLLSCITCSKLHLYCSVLTRCHSRNMRHQARSKGGGGFRGLTSQKNLRKKFRYIISAYIQLYIVCPRPAD